MNENIDRSKVAAYDEIYKVFSDQIFFERLYDSFIQRFDRGRIRFHIRLTVGKGPR